MSGASFLGDYFTALQIWRGLTTAQRKALKFPWRVPHPRVVAALTAKGLWDERGATRSGLAVTLCHFISQPPTGGTT